MSISANGASDALGMGPSAGYNLNSVITVLCVLTVSISMSYLHAVAFVRDIHMHIYVITNLLIFYFWIKLTMKIPNFLTWLVHQIDKTPLGGKPLHAIGLSHPNLGDVLNSVKILVDDVLVNSPESFMNEIASILMMSQSKPSASASSLD